MNNNSGVIVVGAGGHAKVVIEIFRSMNVIVAYCTGEVGSSAKCADVPVLIGDDNLERLYNQGYNKIFVAVGSNKLRHKIAMHCIKIGYVLTNAISPFAVISTSVTLGFGIAIMPGVVINAETEIKDLAIVNTGAKIDHDCKIGYAVHIAPNSALAGNVNVGDYTFLGVGSSVIPGIQIGNYSIIGAGGVVINDIGDLQLAVGVPAKVIKHLL